MDSKKKDIEGDWKSRYCDICGMLQLLVFMKGSWKEFGQPSVELIEFNKMTICKSEVCKKKAKNKAFL